MQMGPQQGSAVCSCPHTMPTGQHRPLRPSRSSCSRTRPNPSIRLRRQQPLLLRLLHMGRRRRHQPRLPLPQLLSHHSQVCRVHGELLDLRQLPVLQLQCCQ